MACMELEKEMDTQGILLVSVEEKDGMKCLKWSNDDEYFYDE